MSPRSKLNQWWVNWCARHNRLWIDSERRKTFSLSLNLTFSFSSYRSSHSGENKKNCSWHWISAMWWHGKGKRWELEVWCERVSPKMLDDVYLRTTAPISIRRPEIEWVSAAIYFVTIFQPMPISLSLMSCAPKPIIIINESFFPSQLGAQSITVETLVTQ